MDLSVIIPAFNEEKRIEPTLEKVITYCKQHFTNYEIIVIDDGSTDRTADVVTKYTDQNVRLIKNTKNMGKGFSVKLGMINAKLDPILFTDSDLNAPIEETKKLLDAIQDGYNVAIGSRNIEGANVVIEQPKYRQFLGKTFPLIVRSLLLPDFKDTQCGLKVFRKDAARKIFPRQTLCRFAFDVEVLFIAKKLGLKVKEIPVTWMSKEGSKVSPVKDSLNMLRDILKIKYNNARNAYD